MGELIGRLAKQKGISIRKLATSVGMNYQTLYSAVNRKSNRINSKYIPLIAKELGVSPEYLTGIENPYDELSFSEKTLLRSIDYILAGVDDTEKSDMALHIAFFLEQQRDLIVSTYQLGKTNRY